MIGSTEGIDLVGIFYFRRSRCDRMFFYHNVYALGCISYTFFCCRTFVL